MPPNQPPATHLGQVWRGPLDRELHAALQGIVLHSGQPLHSLAHALGVALRGRGAGTAQHIMCSTQQQQRVRDGCCLTALGAGGTPAAAADRCTH